MNKREFQGRLTAKPLGGQKLPRVAQPDAQRRVYYKRIVSRVLEPAMKLIRELLVPRLEELAANASRIATTDAQDDLGDIIDEIANQFFDKMSRRELNRVVRPVAVEVANFEAVQLNRQLSAAIGEEVAVNVVGGEEWLPKAIDEFTRENVALIRSVPEKLFSDLEKYLSREIADGARWEDLAATLEERYSVSQSDAERIARDQVGKFNGDLNRVRQTDLGITRFIWRSMADERVRDEHQARNGKSYDWAEGADGETPGEPIMCRCYADPDIASALE